MRQTDRQTDKKQTEKKIDRQTDRQSYRQADRQSVLANKATDVGPDEELSNLMKLTQ